jgi:hypothetical protein
MRMRWARPVVLKGEEKNAYDFGRRTKGQRRL